MLLPATLAGEGDNSDGEADEPDQDLQGCAVVPGGTVLWGEEEEFSSSRQEGGSTSSSESKRMLPERITGMLQVCTPSSSSSSSSEASASQSLPAETGKPRIEVIS